MYKKIFDLIYEELNSILVNHEKILRIKKVRNKRKQSKICFLK